MSNAFLEVERSKELVEINGEKLSELWWELDATQQALFFNAIGELDSTKLAHQLQAISDDDELTAYGMEAMRSIGEYSSVEI